MQVRNYFILAKETADFCFSVHFSYLSVAKSDGVRFKDINVISILHHTVPSFCATAAQITTIITITTR